MNEKKERETKLKFSHSIFSTVRRINGTLGVHFTLEYVRVFIYKSFALLCSGYLGAAPIPYPQGTFLNLPNSYLSSTTILIDLMLNFTCFLNCSLDLVTVISSYSCTRCMCFSSIGNVLCSSCIKSTIVGSRWLFDNTASLERFAQSPRKSALQIILILYSFFNIYH